MIWKILLAFCSQPISVVTVPYINQTLASNYYSVIYRIHERCHAHYFIMNTTPKTTISEKDGVLNEDTNVRAKFRVFALRCVRQTNDVVLLHKMLHVYINLSSSSLTKEEFDLCSTMTSAIRDRLDELHCQWLWSGWCTCWGHQCARELKSETQVCPMLDTFNKLYVVRLDLLWGKGLVLGVDFDFWLWKVRVGIQHCKTLLNVM